MQILYTPEQIKEVFGFKSTESVRRLFDEGQLTGVILRQGVKKRVLRFRESDVDKFIALRAKRTGELMK